VAYANLNDTIPTAVTVLYTDTCLVVYYLLSYSIQSLSVSAGHVMLKTFSDTVIQCFSYVCD